MHIHTHVIVAVDSLNYSKVTFVSDTDVSVCFFVVWFCFVFCS